MAYRPLALLVCWNCEAHKILGGGGGVGGLQLPQPPLPVPTPML